MNYVGTELELFQHAVNWKRYWSAAVKPFVRGRVLDVGCGLGANARYLFNDLVTSYAFLEPDAALLQQVPQHAGLPPTLPQRRIQGTTSSISGEYFDTVLYIDVLEHIPDASSELERASGSLAAGGHLIIVVPAFQFLYSPFDKAIGHVTRYDRQLLRAQMPSTLKPISLRYLDSVGLLLSLGNKLLLRRSAPSLSQITFWDKRIVPISRFMDELVIHSFGRSLVAVYRKT